MPGPYTARYPQNTGYAGLANSLAAQNQARGLRGPVQPYQPSVGDPGVSGVGRYGLALQYATPQNHPGLQGGLMNNQGASFAYANTGYMPNKTVGGGYGIANPYAGRQPGYAPYSGQGGGAPSLPAPGLAGPMNALAQQNPGGQWYQGATPGMVAYSGGLRPGFFGGGPSGEAPGGSQDVAEANLIRKGYVKNDAGSWTPGPSMRSPGLAGIMVPATGAYAAGPGAAGMGGGLLGGGLAGPTIAQQKQQVTRGATLARVELRNQNRAQALEQQQLGLLAAFHPEAAVAMAGIRQQGQYQQGLLGLQGQALTQQGDIARQGFEQKNLDRSQRMELASLQTQQSALQRMHELAIQSGNHAAAAQLAAQHDANAQKLAEITSGAQERIAGIAGQTQRDIAKENRGPQHEQIQLQREQLAQQRADSLRQQAQQAYQSGDIQRAQQLESMANQAMGAAMGASGVSQPGLLGGNTPLAPPQPGAGLAGGLAGPTQSWAQLPHSARMAIRGNSAEEMVRNIRTSLPGLSQAAADQMIAEAYPGTTVTMYNPSGHNAADAIGAFTGLENANRWMRVFSGRGPQPPMINGPFGLRMPVPVIPGGIGNVTTYGGY